MQVPAADEYEAIALEVSPAAFSTYVGLEPDPWQRRLLLSQAHHILLNCSRQSGKTSVISTLALHEVLYKPGSTVLAVAPSQRQSAELAYKAMMLYRQIGRPVEATSESALQLHLANGSRLIATPASEATVRGYSVDLLLIDEASRVPDDFWFALLPMLAARPHGRIIAASTPWGARGWWHAEWIGDPLAWERYEVPASACPRISPEQLQRDRAAMGEARYLAEYWCQFTASESLVFDLDEVRAVIRPREENAPCLSERFPSLSLGLAARQQMGRKHQQQPLAHPAMGRFPSMMPQ